MIISQEIQAVIFDMDGLLLDTERQNLRAWDIACRTLGYDVAPIYPTVIGRGAKACDEIFQQYFGPNFPVVEMRRQKVENLKVIEEEEGIPVKDGAIELLSLLRSSKFPISVATASEKPLAERRLSRGGIREFFPVLCTKDEVARGKPSPDLFLLASDRMNVKPSACLVLEDSHSGVQAALAAEMQVLMVPDLVTPESWVAEKGVSTLKSLREVVPLLFPAR